MACFATICHFQSRFERSLGREIVWLMKAIEQNPRESEICSVVDVNARNVKAVPGFALRWREKSKGKGLGGFTKRIVGGSDGESKIPWA